MKCQRLLGIAAVLVFSTFILKADPIVPEGDPGIIIRGVSLSFPVGMEFSVSFPESPTEPGVTAPCTVGESFIEDCALKNDSDLLWSVLTFVAPIQDAFPYSCPIFEDSPFSSCTAEVGETQVVFSFFGGSGIGPGESFQLQVFGWEPFTTLSAQASPPNMPVPGPAALPLLVLGLAGVALGRKIWVD